MGKIEEREGFFWGLDLFFEFGRTGRIWIGVALCSSTYGRVFIFTSGYRPVQRAGINIAVKYG